MTHWDTAPDCPRRRVLGRDATREHLRPGGCGQPVEDIGGWRGVHSGRAPPTPAALLMHARDDDLPVASARARIATRLGGREYVVAAEPPVDSPVVAEPLPAGTALAFTPCGPTRFRPHPSGATR